MFYNKLVLILLILLILLITSTLQAGELLEHRTLLQAHQFKMLEKKLQQYNDQYLKGQASLRDYYWSIDTLWLSNDLDDKWLGDALQAWKKQTPDSAYMNIVLGKYYTDKAYVSRGTGWASEVSSEQFSQMELFFETAGHYFKQGLKKNPVIVDGHIESIGIIRTSRSDNSKNADKTLVENLLAYTASVPKEVKQKEAYWSHLLQSAIPRWGGSYAEMNAIIKQAAAKYKSLTSADISMLKDTIIYDQMSMAVINADYTTAFALGEKRIKANTDYAGIYLTAANAAYNLKDYAHCFAYAQRATERRPWRSFGWNRLGICAVKLQKWPEANLAYRTKIVLDGIDKYDVFQLGVTYMYLYQFDRAYAMFKKAEDLDPDYKKYTRQYTQYIEKEKRESMNLIGQDVNKIIGSIEYVGDNSK